MIRFPNAKINLGLFVTEKRSDGYHNLETVFYPVSIKDALEINPSDDFSMSTKGLPIAGDGKDNLVWKALELLRKDFLGKIEPLQITLLKNIPMGAGMGGGSADGAAMLLLLNDYFSLGLSQTNLLHYALQLGSDCPFFIYNKPCFASGRGELLTPITLDLSAYSLQIICPNIHINTRLAFEGLQPKSATFDLKSLPSLALTEWKNVVRNDFETSVFKVHPVLEHLKESLYEAGALYAAMSGSGSTIFGIFPKGVRLEGKMKDARVFYFQ